jgi:hypothetical protein
MLISICHLIQKKNFVRVGQSKVLFGFENLQSSQNRLTLDRNDALNSAVANERDLGVLLLAPSKIRERFAMLVKDGYKGSGDYGVFAFGVQWSNLHRTEGNRNPRGNQSKLSVCHRQSDHRARYSSIYR